MELSKKVFKLENIICGVRMLGGIMIRGKGGDMKANLSFKEAKKE